MRLSILLLLSIPALAQTRAHLSQVKQYQIDLDGCVQVQSSPGGFSRVLARVAPFPGKTRLKVSQLRKPPTAPEGDCWPLDMSAQTALRNAAWAVINTRCTKCHDYPEDTSPGVRIGLNVLGNVGNLNMRTRVSIMRGGNRGPALIPGNLYGSLIFLFASRCQVCSMTNTMGGGPLPPLRDLQAAAQTAGFAHVLPDSNEDSVGMPPFYQLTEGELFALRDWILAGAP